MSIETKDVVQRESFGSTVATNGSRNRATTQDHLSVNALPVAPVHDLVRLLYRNTRPAATKHD